MFLNRPAVFAVNPVPFAGGSSWGGPMCGAGSHESRFP